MITNQPQIGPPARTRPARRIALGVLGLGLVSGGVAASSGYASATTTPPSPPFASSTPAPPAAAVPAPAEAPETQPVVAGDDAARAAFFGAGYTYDDAVALGELWKIDDTWQVKVRAGRAVAAGERLPVEAGSAGPADTEDPVAGSAVGEEPVVAFLDAGYDYDDAVALAQAWGTSDVWSAKVKAGKILQAGGDLPALP